MRITEMLVMWTTAGLCLAAASCATIREGMEVRPAAGPQWLEMPAMCPNRDQIHIAHEMTVCDTVYRNYSFLYDRQARVALWVAYPLNRTLIGEGRRTDAWGLDPKVPREDQPLLLKGFGVKGYDRGHQIPSADRLSANRSTFYGTNMTPQLGRLNQRAWARLEGMVREWSYSFDTLYVVTGADIRGCDSFVMDNEGKPVAVPKGYFKALLGYRRDGSVGISASTGGYTGIGFYFEHRDYCNPSAEEIMGEAMTIDELERLLGYDFFCNLPSVTDKAALVESELDSWWAGN